MWFFSNMKLECSWAIYTIVWCSRACFNFNLTCFSGWKHLQLQFLSVVWIRQYAWKEKTRRGNDSIKHHCISGKYRRQSSRGRYSFVLEGSKPWGDGNSISGDRIITALKVPQCECHICPSLQARWHHAGLWWRHICSAYKKVLCLCLCLLSLCVWCVQFI